MIETIKSKSSNKKCLRVLLILGVVAAPFGIGFDGQPRILSALAGGSESGGGHGGGHENDGAVDNNENSNGENPNSPDGIKFKINGDDIEVHHQGGAVELIKSDQYELKDKWGRRIVKRSATAADRARLIAFTKK